MHKVIGVLGMALMVANGVSAARSPEPAATLLVPRFEVSDDRKYDTTLTVTNRSESRRVVRITIWSDHGFPLAWFPLTFEPHQTKPLVMSDFLQSRYRVGEEKGHPLCGSGFGPPPEIPCRGYPLIPPPIAWKTSCLLSGGIDREWCPSPVGSRQVHRIGYVTLDVVKDELAAITTVDGGPVYAAGLEMANVLTGSFAQHANGEILGSWPMVHLHAREHLKTTFYGRFSNGTDRREPLPSSMTVTMTRGSAAELLIWREPNENSQQCDRIRESSLVLETQSVTDAPDHMTLTSKGQIYVLVSKPSPRHLYTNLPHSIATCRRRDRGSRYKFTQTLFVCVYFSSASFP